MKLSEINPMVRFACTVSIPASRPTTMSCDSRLFYICEGACRLVVDGREHTLREGALLLWKGGTPYRFLTDRPFRLIAVNFDFTQAHLREIEPIPLQLKSFSPDLVLENVSFTDFEVLNAPIVLPNAQEARAKVERIRAEFSGRKPGYEALCSALMKELIAETACAAQFSESRGGEKLGAILRYIERNFDRPLSNEELAERAGYHVYHLNRIMKSAYGLTLHRYVANFRVEKAKEYLVGTSLPISAIAEKCGFRTPFYFAAVFRRQCGVSPSEYRKIHHLYV